MQLTRANEEIYNSLASGIRAFNGTAGSYRHLIIGQALPLEFAPYINRIISPPLRPVCSTNLGFPAIYYLTNAFRLIAKSSRLESVHCFLASWKLWYLWDYVSYKKRRKMVSWYIGLTRMCPFPMNRSFTKCDYSPIDVFVTYDGKRAPDIAVSRYAVRHLVASEVRLPLLSEHRKN